MVQVEPASAEEEPQWARGRPLIAILGAIPVGLFLGYLGWILPSVGGSVIVPAMIVFGIGAALVVVCWVVGTFRHRASVMVFALGAATVTVLASLWTFEFSLPAAISFSNATNEAQAALLRLQHGDGVHVGSAHSPGVVLPCAVHAAGGVGPLSAPYRECAAWSAEGHFVTFSSTSTQLGGLGYTDIGANTFPDECVRHLTGNWWMYTSADLSVNDPGACPFGYRFQGGG